MAVQKMFVMRGFNFRINEDLEAFFTACQRQQAIEEATEWDKKGFKPFLYEIPFGDKVKVLYNWKTRAKSRKRAA